ncbi:MAG: hypothetical protein FD165_1509 [Gammaproteobacteria bacterium]|nr:MAG: hypothetical protein FD165_1509 [Gammaproteobacteria bacterium]TND02480.1 MAG: hypothetical protein FD120_2221 [Gammaproteobacteria bacterium]
MLRYLLLPIIALILSAPVRADNTADTAQAGINYATLYGNRFELAAADDTADKTPDVRRDKEASDDKPLFEERWFTANKMHKYLGIGSIGAAALTLLAPKEEDGAHEFLARTAAALGVGAVATGLTFHWNDFDLSEGFKNPDNTHMLLTTLGTLGFLYAVSKAPEAHGGVGAASAIGMLVGIKMTW